MTVGLEYEIREAWKTHHRSGLDGKGAQPWRIPRLQVRIQGKDAEATGLTSSLMHLYQRLPGQPQIPTRVIGTDSDASDGDDSA